MTPRERALIDASLSMGVMTGAVATLIVIAAASLFDMWWWSALTLVGWFVWCLWDLVKSWRKAFGRSTWRKFYADVWQAIRDRADR